MIRVVPSIKLPKPDYSTQSSMIDKRRIKDLEDKLIEITKRNQFLSDWISR